MLKYIICSFCGFSTPVLNSTHIEILNLLDKEKEYALYQMPKKLKKSYRTILRRTHELERNGLIFVKRTEPSTKKGLDKKIYAKT